MATTRPFVTDEDVLRLPKDGRKYELVDGKLVVSPAGLRHEQIVVRLIGRLLAFDSPRRLGEVFGSSAGYRLPGGNIRSPGVSFVAAGRLPEGPAPAGFGELGCDLAVEVLSPSDDPRAVLDKVGEYLRAGVRFVWVIDSDKRSAAVYRSLTDVHEVGLDDSLQAEDLLPGFRCPLTDLLG